MASKRTLVPRAVDVKRRAGDEMIKFIVDILRVLTEELRTGDGNSGARWNSGDTLAVSASDRVWSPPITTLEDVPLIAKRYA